MGASLWFAARALADYMLSGPGACARGSRVLSLWPIKVYGSGNWSAARTSSDYMLAIDYLCLYGGSTILRV